MSSPEPEPNLRRPTRPVWALVALVVCVPLIAASLRNLKMVNDVETWLPAGDAGARVLRWAQAHFEPENRFLVSWDTSSLADSRIVALAERLQPPDQPLPADNPLSLIREVVTPHHVLTRMVERGVDRDTAVSRLTGVLVGHGPMKVRLTEAGQQETERVQAELQSFAERELGLSLTFLPPLPQPHAIGAPAVADPNVPAGDDDDEQFTTADWRPPAHDFQFQWPGMHPDSPAASRLQSFATSLKTEQWPLVAECFFAAGAPVALSISVAERGDDALRAAIHAVSDLAAEVGVAPEELRLGGSPIGRIQLNLQSAKSVWNTDYPWWMFHKRSPLALSAIVGTVLAFALLKSIRLAILVLFTAVYTAAATVALIPATGQSLNTVLMVMPDLLLVITMSGLIHISNYWRHGACAGLPDPVGAAVRTAWEPCLLAAVTTAIGMASLVTSVLMPVRQFGLYSAAGCLLSTIAVLWILPALLRVWPGRPAPLAPPHENAWHHFGLWLAGHHRAISVCCLLLYGVSVWGLTYFKTETKVIRYFPDTSRIAHDYHFIEDNLAGTVGVDVILRFPPEAPRRADDADDDGPAPSPAARLDLFHRMELVRQVQDRLRKIEGVTGALSLTDFRNEQEERPQEVNVRYLRSLQVARKRIFETQQEETREFITHASTPLSVVRDGVPIHVEVGEQVWRIRAQCSVLTDRQYADFLHEIDAVLDEELRAHPGVGHLTTGMVPLFLRTQEALLESLINSFGLAFATIGAVMMYQLRSFAGGFLAMLPNILPIAFVFGAVSWCGVPLDVGTMITASIAMGIAVDSELHFVTWFRQCLHQGMSREEAMAHALTHCGPAMWQSCVVIALALLMMAFADLLIISRFGWLMAALIIAAMLADLFYMPALLAGVMGRLIERKMRRAGELPAEATPNVASAPAPASR